MARFLRNAVIGWSLFLLGTAANARVHKERGEYNQQISVVDQVRADLKGVMNMGSLSGSQRSALAHAKHDLTVFDRSFSRRRFNRHEMDRAINRIQGVVSSGR